MKSIIDFIKYTLIMLGLMFVGWAVTVSGLWIMGVL